VHNEKLIQRGLNLANEDDDGWQMMDLNIHLHQVVAQKNDRADGKHPEISSDSKDCRFVPEPDVVGEDFS
jgi:hypothetical protein